MIATCWNHWAGSITSLTRVLFYSPGWLRMCFSLLVTGPLTSKLIPSQQQLSYWSYCLGQCLSVYSSWSSSKCSTPYTLKILRKVLKTLDFRLLPYLMSRRKRNSHYSKKKLKTSWKTNPLVIHESFKTLIEICYKRIPCSSWIVKMIHHRRVKHRLVRIQL